MPMRALDIQRKYYPSVAKLLKEKEIVTDRLFAWKLGYILPRMIDVEQIDRTQRKVKLRNRNLIIKETRPAAWRYKIRIVIDE